MLYYPKAKLHLIKNHSNIGQIQRVKNIILHSTEGTTADGAIRTLEASSGKGIASAHIVIDRDDPVTIYQLIDFKDVAWHASQANYKSIGIEHAAMNSETADYYNKTYASRIKLGLQKPFSEKLLTEPQYKASAELVAWLCYTLKLPCNRTTVLTHNEASPADKHVKCFSGVADPNKVVEIANQILAHNKTSIT